MASLAMRVQQESGVVDRHKSNEVRGDMFMHVSAVLHVESDVGQNSTLRVSNWRDPAAGPSPLVTWRRACTRRLAVTAGTDRIGCAERGVLLRSRRLTDMADGGHYCVS